MIQVHVEIPPGDGQTQLLEVPASVLAVADETDLHVAVVPVPVLGLTLVVFTTGGDGAVAHCEIAPDDTQTVIVEVPADAGLPVADEESLDVLQGGLPGAVLVLLKTA